MNNAKTALGLLVVLGALFFAVLILFGPNDEQNAQVEINGTVVPPVPTLDTMQVQSGATLYAQYCTECHGANLEGQEDWKKPNDDGSFPAPPHDDSGHTWHHPDAQLLEMIAIGGAPYGGTMPGFEEQLKLKEMEHILAFIKSNWQQESRDYQWWLTAANVPLPP